MNLNNYWVVDVEGNGGSPPEIVEIAMIEIANFEPTGLLYHKLLKPSSPITRRVTRIHGITNEDVELSPEIKDVKDEIISLTNKKVIIGHNVRVEFDVISRQIPEWRPSRALDTLKLARIVMPNQKSFRLENLGGVLEISEKAKMMTGARHHSALFDATLTALLFRKLMERVDADLHEEFLQEVDILFNAQESFL